MVAFSLLELFSLSSSSSLLQSGLISSTTSSGSSSLSFIILIITCAEITIVLCYFQLCSEDYLWWWRSYLTSGSSALHLFLYATFYFFTNLEITKPASGILYLGYMLIASYAFFVLTGTIGFCACVWFTRLIYSSVKIDWGFSTHIGVLKQRSRSTVSSSGINFVVMDVPLKRKLQCGVSFYLLI